MNCTSRLDTAKQINSQKNLLHRFQRNGQDPETLVPSIKFS